LTDRDLGLLQFTTVLYYLHETNPANGLVRDRTDPNAPVSSAAVGMALATIPVVVERGVLYRDFAAKITRKRLRYLADCQQGPEPDASGYRTSRTAGMRRSCSRNTRFRNPMNFIGRGLAALCS